MTGWRVRLAAIRSRHADAEKAVTLPDGANGTIGTNGIGMETANAAAVAACAAFYARFQAEAAERAAVFGSEGEARPYQPGEPDPLRDGLLQGWRAHRPFNGERG